MRRDESAAVAAAAALFAEPAEEETEVETAAEQETPEEGVVPQEAEVEEQPLFPEFEIELPEDLEEELSAPTAEEIQRELEQDEEYVELDDEGRRLLARVRYAEREAAFYRDQRLQSEKKNWVEEAKKFFPLSEPFLDEISSDSRRGFLREAKKRHEVVLPLVKPIVDRAQAEIALAKETAMEEGRREAAEQWGSTPRGTATPTEASITQADLARNRSKGDLASTIKEMLFPKKGD